MSEGIWMDVGGVRFHVEYRRFGGDFGPAIRVFGNVAGKEVQLLRFDMFERSPHYHYDPNGFDGHHHIDRAVVPDVIAWTLVQIRDNLKTMIKTAGYREFSETVDQQAVAEAVPELRKAIEKVSQE